MTYYNKYLKYKDKYFQARNEYENLTKCKTCNNNNNNNSCNCVTQSGGEPDEKKSNKAELILFKAEWCGHCNNFKSTWDKIQQNLNTQVNIKTYDADTTAHKTYFDKYNVQGFPTLILVHNSKIIEYSGARDLESVTDFVNNYI